MLGQNAVQAMMAEAFGAVTNVTEEPHQSKETSAATVTNVTASSEAGKNFPTEQKKPNNLSNDKMRFGENSPSRGSKAASPASTHCTWRPDVPSGPCAQHSSTARSRPRSDTRGNELPCWACDPVLSTFCRLARLTADAVLLALSPPCDGLLST